MAQNIDTSVIEPDGFLMKRILISDGPLAASHTSSLATPVGVLELM